MNDCSCGGTVDDGDPNGPICTNSGKYVSACTNGEVEIRAQIDLIDVELDELTDLLQGGPDAEFGGLLGV